MTPEPLNDAEQLIVREGIAAANLLASETLLSVFKSIQVEAFATFTESKPHEREARDHLYNLTQGLKAIEAELIGRVQKKDAIERRLNDEASDDADDLIDDADFGSSQQD